jgi:CHASE2 domain-containing sensor protein
MTENTALEPKNSDMTHDQAGENTEMDQSTLQAAVTATERRLLQFQLVASLALGTLSGLLIGLPLAQTQSPLVASCLMTVFGLMGLLIGYRRRKDRAFLYICFAVVLLLSGTISTSLVPENIGRMP